MIRQTPTARRQMAPLFSLAIAFTFVAPLSPSFVIAQQQLPDKELREIKDVFTKPAGPFAVGTHEYFWIDDKREESFTKDPSDKRHVLARVWYPAQPTPGREPSKYVLDGNEFREGTIYRSLTNIRTNSVTDAPLAADQRFPVLVYEPGGGLARFMGTFEAEQLASRGYFVVAPDHAGFSETVLYPDGYKFKADAHLAPAPTNNRRESVLKSWEWLNNEVFPTWIADSRFTLDKIEELDRTPRQLFHHRLDLSHIGMVGFSFGGATAIQMSRNDPRIRAVVDQDGQLFGDVRDKGTSRPFMLMHHRDDKAAKSDQQEGRDDLRRMLESWDQSLIQNSTSDSYEVTIANTWHGHFSDYMFFLTPDKTRLDPRRAHEIIVAYTLAFFGKYLLGRDSELLKAQSQEYPEVTLTRKDG